MIHSHPESTPSFKKLHMFFMLGPKTNYCSGISDERYLDLSATIVEGDDSVDVGAVGLEAAAGVGGLKELQMTNKESGVRSSLNGHRHRGLSAGHAGFNWR